MCERWAFSDRTISLKLTRESAPTTNGSSFSDTPIRHKDGNIVVVNMCEESNVVCDRFDVVAHLHAWKQSPATPWNDANLISYLFVGTLSLQAHNSLTPLSPCPICAQPARPDVAKHGAHTWALQHACVKSFCFTLNRWFSYVFGLRIFSRLTCFAHSLFDLTRTHHTHMSPAYIPCVKFMHTHTVGLGIARNQEHSLCSFFIWQNGCQWICESRCLIRLKLFSKHVRAFAAGLSHSILHRP